MAEIKYKPRYRNIKGIKFLEFASRQNKKEAVKIQKMWSAKGNRTRIIKGRYGHHVFVETAHTTRQNGTN